MTPQNLQWQSNSYYRLRDPARAARILAVEADRLRGEILYFAKLRWLNGEPFVEPSEIEGPEEWDLNGNCPQDASRDLMELIRRRWRAPL